MEKTSEKTSQQLEKTSEKTSKQLEKTSEKTPQQLEEKTSQEPETTLPLPENIRPRSRSVASEEGVEGTPKKERSAGRVKKSKSKTKKNGSSPRPLSSGDVDGLDAPLRTAEESVHTAKDGECYYGQTSVLILTVLDFYAEDRTWTYLCLYRGTCSTISE